MKRWIKRLVLLAAAAGVVGLIVYSFQTPAVEVDVAPVSRGLLRVTVDREGKTRIRDRYVVSAPLGGRLRRIDLRAGDVVHAGKTILAVIEPNDPALLDAREKAEIEAKVKRAEEAVKEAVVKLDHAATVLDRAQRVGRSISREELELAEYKYRSAAFGVKIAEFELELARAALVRTQPRSPGETEPLRLEIPSPVSGAVLEVFQESARVVPAGAELLKLGDTANLESVIDLLSADAVRVRHAMETRGEGRVFLEHWGGERPLLGRVRRVEPGGFTKVSSLGVEEQRVNVIVDFTEPLARWKALGDAYRVEARIVIWERDNVLKVPAGALFRRGGTWAVFVVNGSRAELRPLRVGQNNGLEAEVLEGLGEGERVILHPTDRVKDGVSVAARDGG